MRRHGLRTAAHAGPTPTLPAPRVTCVKVFASFSPIKELSRNIGL